MMKKTSAEHLVGRPFSFGQWALTAPPAYKACKQCGLSKLISDFHAAKGNSDGRKRICKSCHASKYSVDGGYISPSQSAAKRATADRKVHCEHCNREVLRSEWPRQASGHLKSRCATCMAAYRTPKPKKGLTPEQRAKYRRSRGEAVGEYVPLADRERRRQERTASRHDNHVGAWRRELARTARVAAVQSLHSAHVAAFKHSAVQFRLRYANDTAFAVKQRLRTQLRKKAKLFPKLDDLMRDAINRRGESHTVESICGYRIADLVAHLGSLFVDGMDWHAFMRGEIHIDHVRPQSSFDLMDHEQVRACWALHNLQPLWAADNLAKGARLDWRSGRLAA